MVEVPLSAQFPMVSLFTYGNLLCKSAVLEVMPTVSHRYIRSATLCGWVRKFSRASAAAKSRDVDRPHRKEWAHVSIHKAEPHQVVHGIVFELPKDQCEAYFLREYAQRKEEVSVEDEFGKLIKCYTLTAFPSDDEMFTSLSSRATDEPGSPDINAIRSRYAAAGISVWGETTIVPREDCLLGMLTAARKTSEECFRNLVEETLLADALQTPLKAYLEKNPQSFQDFLDEDE